MKFVFKKKRCYVYNGLNLCKRRYFQEQYHFLNNECLTVRQMFRLTNNNIAFYTAKIDPMH